ncbi:MAG: carboxylesterase [Zymomonas sp.]|nr:carboxylesterase [Zymomonas sp.]
MTATGYISNIDTLFRQRRKDMRDSRSWSFRHRPIFWSGAGLLALVAAALGWVAFTFQAEHFPPAAPVTVDGPVMPVTLKTEGGTLTGYRDRDLIVFKGIPYAAPPVGALRWRAPQPPASWQGDRDATHFGNDCLQNKPDWDPTRSAQAMSEDCLTINIWSPAKVPVGGAPVMFWIHGGGFVIGSSSQPVLDGSALARRGVTVVTFNYRLGRFGFFAHPALSAEAGDGPTGNWGLMDQLAALRWVHANIARFGGNPAAVTLFGQSAGGASVAQFMLDPEARGLFAGAIIQSSGGNNHWARLSEDRPGQPSGLSAGIAFAKDNKLDNPDAAALRALPADKIVGDISMTNLQSKSYAGPLVDGRQVRSDFLDGFMAGKEVPVPLLVGSTDRELSHLPAIARWGLRQWAKHEIGDGLDKVRSSYDSGDSFDDNIVNDWGFAEPAWTMAQLHAAHGAQAWLYRFGYVSEARRKTFDGAPHASDVAFVFDTLGHEGIAPTDQDHEMAKIMADYWSGFARQGVPTANGLPLWPSINSAEDRMMSFDARGRPTMITIPRQASITAISGIYSNRQ